MESLRLAIACWHVLDAWDGRKPYREFHSEMQEAAFKLGLQIRDRVERALVKCHGDLGGDFYQTVARCSVGTDPDGLGMFVLIDGSMVWRGGWKRVANASQLDWSEVWLREPKEFAR